jgi:hypothetical protein
MVTRKHKNKSQRQTRRNRRGGSTKQINTTPALSNGYEHGNSPRSNAAGAQTASNNKQALLNNTHGGSQKIKRQKKSVGGSAARPNTLTVPQFSDGSAPAVSPQNANSTSVAANTTSVAGTVNASNDCYATNSCGTSGGSRRKCRNKSKRTRNRKNRRTHIKRKRGGTRRVRWGCMS